MVYIRKVVRGGKVYLYKYKSERVGNKVKSVYIGRVLEGGVKEKPVLKKKIVSKKPEISRVRVGRVKTGIDREKKDVASKLLKFDDVLRTIQNNLDEDRIKEAVSLYKNLLKLYNNLIEKVDNEDRFKLYDKIKPVYENLHSRAEQLGYKIK